MELTKERVAVYIDGNNFYNRLKSTDVPPSKRFDYSALVDFLVRGRTLISKRYYVGVVRNYDQSEKSQRLVEKQQKFLGGLESEGFAIKRGRIVYEHGIREKGVDVKIALDLTVGAVDNWPAAGSKDTWFRCLMMEPEVGHEETDVQ